MPESPSKNFSPEDRKAARTLFFGALRRVLRGIGQRFALHYVVSLAGVVAVNSALLHGSLNPFTAAFGVLGIGLLARWFLPVHLAVKAQPQEPPFIQAPPELLAHLFGPADPGEHHDGAADAAASKLNGPYL